MRPELLIGKFTGTWLGLPTLKIQWQMTLLGFGA